MNIQYIDEYDRELFVSSKNEIPNVGDTVILDSEEWVIKSRIFYPEDDSVTINLTQHNSNNSNNSILSNASDLKLRDIKNTISRISDRQDINEKKTKNLNNKIDTVKQKLDNNIRQEIKKGTTYD